MAGKAAPAGLDALQDALGHRFADLRLLEEALTHPSAEPPKGSKRAQDNDRLEFLGDRVLGLVMADYLHRRYPRAKAGDLARRFNTLVREEALARLAQSIGLGEHLHLSRSEREAGGARKPAILADACEAVLAALYRDGGLDAARRFLVGHVDALQPDLDTTAKDPKSALQEWAAARGLGQPVYEVIDRAGPDHAPVFSVRVAIPERDAAEASAGSKQQAEQAAARALLRAVQDRP